MIINTSGQPGKPGEAGSPGTGFGLSGKRGTDGKNGKDASSIDLVIQATQQGYLLQGFAINQIQRVLELNQDFSLIAIGGKGGAGGPGGSGHHGKPGSKGFNATRFYPGGNGGQGSQGGHGGDGGNAGNGGLGGDITLKVHSYDLDLLMTLQSAQTEGGKGGKAGQEGSGGAGGDGGPGGDSYQYYTTSKNGESRVRYHSGGLQGPKGPSGKSGTTGRQGNDGINGLFQIIVTDLGISSSTRYDLMVAGSGNLQSEDNIFEPGERLTVDSFQVKNRGGLPTPYVHLISIGINTNQFIQFRVEDEKILQNSIPANEFYQLQEQIPFQIKHINEPQVNKPLRKNAIVQFYGRVNRVNRYFSKFPDYQINLPLRYPVELSNVVSQKSISIDEEAPLAIGIRNISSLPLGESHGRIVKLILVQEEGSDQVTWVGQENYSLIPYNNQPFQIIDIPFDSIQPGQTFNIAGSLKFSNFDLPLNTTSHFKLMLLLGEIERPLEQSQIIQVMETHLQLTEKFIYSENSEFLLVINSETPSNIIIGFKQFAELLGTTCSVWNASNYWGFSYNQILQMDAKISTLMKDKIVIIINTPYKNKDGQPHYLLDQMGYQTVFEAAQKYSVATYILSEQAFNQFKLTKLCISNLPNLIQVSYQDDSVILDSDSQNQKSKQVSQMELLDKDLISTLLDGSKEIIIEEIPYKVSLGVPRQQDLIERTKQIESWLRKKFPLTFFSIIYSYQPKILQSNCCSDIYSLGSLKIRKGLSRNRSYIGVREFDNHEQSMIQVDDKYILLKLFPMNKKITLFNKIQDEETRNLLSQAIVSDLLEEVLCFLGAEQYNLQHVSLLMENFQCFETIQINQLINTEFLVKQLISFSGILKNIISFTDKYICCWGKKKGFINSVCNRIRNMVLQISKMRPERYQSLLKYGEKSLLKILRPESYLPLKVFLNNQILNIPVAIQNDQVCEIPIQDIREEEFKFYYNNTGYDFQKRNYVLNGFQSRIKYFD